jgi:hypothetical protein
MRKGTISRVMAADRPYGEFYDFYGASQEYFRYLLCSRYRNLLEQVKLNVKSLHTPQVRRSMVPFILKLGIRSEW